MVTRCIKNLRKVFDTTSPRIGYTCWSTVFRRWTTAQAFQQKGSKCLMGCDNYEDSLDHYAHCNMIRRCARNKLNLHTNPLGSKAIWAFTTNLADNELCKIAHMIYPSYRTTNFTRHAGKTLEEQQRGTLAAQYWEQILHEADKGSHKFCLKTGAALHHNKRPNTGSAQAPPIKKRHTGQTQYATQQLTTGTALHQAHDTPTIQQAPPLLPRMGWTYTHHGIWTRQTFTTPMEMDDNWPRKRRLNDHSTLPAR